MLATAEEPQSLDTVELTALTLLRRWVEARDFSGYDPYDALNSSVLRILSLGSKWGRVAVIQGMKRCPVNLRRLFLVRTGQNPKALGLFLEGYVRLWRNNQDDPARGQITHLMDLLESQRSSGCSGNGWGYNFDWQSRAFFVPRGTPSIVCSSFIGHALLDAWETLHDQRALDLAVPIAQFFLRDLNRTYEGDTFCFSYTPIDTYPVHNANLLGAALLIRLYHVTGDCVLREAALAALAYSMKHQREDGSWFYSERPGSQWIDSFHTGFNLESIRRFLDLGQASEYIEPYSTGVEFYASNFFLPDGTPRYFHDRLYPIDIHSAAEAIYFFSGEAAHSDIAERVVFWTLANMYDGAGEFWFQKHKRFTMRVPYMRWSQAWMFRALTAYGERVILSNRTSET
jgi:hypothetical protein